MQVNIVRGFNDSPSTPVAGLQEIYLSDIYIDVGTEINPPDYIYGMTSAFAFNENKMPKGVPYYLLAEFKTRGLQTSSYDARQIVSYSTKVDKYFRNGVERDLLGDWYEGCISDTITSYWWPKVDVLQRLLNSAGLSVPNANGNWRVAFHRYKAIIANDLLYGTTDVKSLYRSGMLAAEGTMEDIFTPDEIAAFGGPVVQGTKIYDTGNNDKLQVRVPTFEELSGTIARLYNANLPASGGIWSLREHSSNINDLFFTAPTLNPAGERFWVAANRQEGTVEFNPNLPNLKVPLIFVPIQQFEEEE